MESENFLQIFDTIKKDDINLFSSLFNENKNLCFGRFPILSLCYLYKARKIVKKYENSLLEITNYKIANEPFEIYQKFKVWAGRCLRLYLNDQIVTPIEMLAILGKDFKVKKLLKKSKLNNNTTEKVTESKAEETASKNDENKISNDESKILNDENNVSSNIEKTSNTKSKKAKLNLVITDSTIKNLSDIYLIKRQSFIVDGQKVKITQKPLSAYQKSLQKLAITISACFVVLISAFYLLPTFITGIGISSKPFFVYNASQLLFALKSGGNYELKNDITINSSVTSRNFNGEINGENYTIYVNSFSGGALINKNFGTIKNLNVVYGNIEAEVSSSVSLLCKTNSGKLENISITCEALNLTCNKSDKDILISGFSNTNTGTIKNCSLELNANITARGEGECNFAGFASVNNGKVENCILKNGNIEALDCDLSGIVGENAFSASVETSKNYANLKQENVIEKWSPNVAGIVLTNYGAVKNCYNFGELEINSVSNLEDANRAVYIGGICALNFREVDKCLNKGNIIVNSNVRVVYSGGITGQSYYFVDDEEKYFYPKITNCGVACEISVQTQGEEIYVFSGGISGFMFYNAEVTNCYSLATFNVEVQAEAEKPKYFNGSFMGALQYIVTWGGLGHQLTCSNNFVLNNENGIYQVGALVGALGRYDSTEDILDDGYAKHTTKEEILNSGVYWDEQ